VQKNIIQNYEIGDWLCLAWTQLLQFEEPISVIASKLPKEAIVTHQRKSLHNLLYTRKSMAPSVLLFGLDETYW
jgi:hypothetical protein